MKLLALYTTVANADDARRLARGAVEQQLAACVQITPIESVYRWQGAVQQEAEWRLMFKTTAAAAPALRAWVRAHHPYELPALYVLEVNDAEDDYRAWVVENSGGAPR